MHYALVIINITAVVSPSRDSRRPIDELGIIEYRVLYRFAIASLSRRLLQAQSSSSCRPTTLSLHLDPR